MTTPALTRVRGPSQSDRSAAPVSELCQQLGSSSAGLSAEEVQRRLAQYGYNELAEEKVNALLKFLSYLWGPIPWMIEIAAVLSAVVRHWADFWIILAFLVVNAIVGFWEEYQAGNAIATLKKKLALRAKVKRNGVRSTVAARGLVPGDVIRVKRYHHCGNRVVVDGRGPIQYNQVPAGSEWFKTVP